MRSKYTDPYDEAQFSSLWAVVTHASEPDEDRFRLMLEAHQAFVVFQRWRAYRMVFSPVKRYHVGFSYANPKDWFLLSDDGVVAGPFDSKKIILRKLQAKRSSIVRAGVYTYDGWTMFTRDCAVHVGLDEEVLP